MMGWGLLYRAALAGTIALTIGYPAAAEVLIMITRPINWSFTTPTARVPLNGSGALATPQFAYAAGQRFVVTYTAECAVAAAAGNHTAWVDLDIVAINQSTKSEKVLPPTVGSSDAICSANGTVGFDGWRMSTVNAVGAGLAAGNYRIEVRARLNGGATGGWLSDTSLILWR